MKYSANPTILQNHDLGQVAWDAIEPIWDDLPLGKFNALAKFMEELTIGQRGLIALDWCQKEIRNGGFSQLFGNSTGNLLHWAVDGFRMIGAEKYAVICSRAASMLGKDYPKSAAGRKKAYMSLSQPQKQEIEKLEKAFYALLDSQDDDLERYRGEYVKSHPDQFIQSGQDA